MPKSAANAAIAPPDVNISPNPCIGILLGVFKATLATWWLLGVIYILPGKHLCVQTFDNYWYVVDSR